MTRSELVELLAQRLYECRHKGCDAEGRPFPTWEELNRVNANTYVTAVVSQAAADGTLLRVERVVPAAGSFTIYGTAGATAATTVDWSIVNPEGQTKLN